MQRPISNKGRRFRADPERARQWYAAAVARMVKRERVSAGSYMDLGYEGGWCYVFSIADCGGGTFGHPKYTLSAHFTQTEATTCQNK